MRERLYSLFWEDRRSRAQMYLFSAVAGIVMALVSGSQGGTRVEAANVMAVAIVIAVTLWTACYCGLWSRRPEATRVSTGAMPRRLALAGSLAVIATAALLSARRLEAAVANRTLRGFGKGSGPLDEGEQVRLRRVIGYVEEENLRVEPAAVSAVVPRLRVPQSSTEEHELLELAAAAASLASAPQSVLPVHQGTLLFRMSPVSTGNIISGLRFTEVTIRLDNITLEYAVMRRCFILYDGTVGFSVTGCRFVACRFRIADEVNGDTFLEAVIANPENVTFQA